MPRFLFFPILAWSYFGKNLKISFQSRQMQGEKNYIEKIKPIEPEYYMEKLNLSEVLKTGLFKTAVALETLNQSQN